MTVTVRLFAMLRERAGRDPVELELPDDATVADAFDRLAGGDPADLRRSPGPTAWVGDPGAGAIVTFQGVTREVAELDYEAYAEMAEERIGAILLDAIARHDLIAAAAEHRIGRVPRGAPGVVVAVAVGHRGEAFEGAREAIDRIKAEAPIWSIIATVDIEAGRVELHAEARTVGQTGVEMEAMSAGSPIESVVLLSKSGGRPGEWTLDEPTGRCGRRSSPSPPRRRAARARTRAACAWPPSPPALTSRSPPRR